MTEIKDFLDGLKSSKEFSTSIDIILNFKERNVKLQLSEIEEMIKIIGENYQVFGILRPLDESIFPKNKQCREFISKYVDILMEERESLDEYTLKNLNKVFNAIYLSLLRKDKSEDKRKNKREQDIFLYHANSVITSLEFIKSKKLFSRKYGEDMGLPQTYQKSDEVDKQKGIFNDIFFDNCDIGENRPCYYGPITFVFDAEKILRFEREIKITKNNPIHKSDTYMYFSSLAELESQMLKYREEKGSFHFYTKFKHHTTVKNCSYIEITKDNLKRIIIENDKNIAKLNDNNKSTKSEQGYSSKKIKKMIEHTLEKVNLEEIEVIIRKEDCKKQKADKDKEDVSKYSTNIEELWSSDLEVISKRNN